jgi:hypothetical protein
MDNTKQITAAISAVMNYIRTEEEAICIQEMATPPVEPAADASAAVSPVRLWGVSGRQGQMQMRQMMQRRTFR